MGNIVTFQCNSLVSNLAKTTQDSNVWHVVWSQRKKGLVRDFSLVVLADNGGGGSG